ncbi:MAG: hypothetical protein AB7P03_09845 [Kofleriaceae bacterium]
MNRNTDQSDTEREQDRGEAATIEPQALTEVMGGKSEVSGSVGTHGVSGSVKTSSDRNECFEVNKHRPTKDVERLCGSDKKDREDKKKNTGWGWGGRLG